MNFFKELLLLICILCITHGANYVGLSLTLLIQLKRYHFVIKYEIHLQLLHEFHSCIG
uniref:Uncharacterized protein n=1 Tax=Trichobilharzia regenti TaxID=157069 RepID=A0AA85J5U0_TRIRE|nr:unnamed protein product [Trichobilharzia regenti]